MGNIVLGLSLRCIRYEHATYMNELCLTSMAWTGRLSVHRYAET